MTIATHVRNTEERRTHAVSAHTVLVASLVGLPTDRDLASWTEQDARQWRYQLSLYQRNVEPFFEAFGGVSQTSPDDASWAFAFREAEDAVHSATLASDRTSRIGFYGLGFPTILAVGIATAEQATAAEVAAELHRLAARPTIYGSVLADERTHRVTSHMGDWRELKLPGGFRVWSADDFLMDSVPAFRPAVGRLDMMTIAWERFDLLSRDMIPAEDLARVALETGHRVLQVVNPSPEIAEWVVLAVSHCLAIDYGKTVHIVEYSDGWSLKHVAAELERAGGDGQDTLVFMPSTVDDIKELLGRYSSLRVVVSGSDVLEIPSDIVSIANLPEDTVREWWIDCMPASLHDAFSEVYEVTQGNPELLAAVLAGLDEHLTLHEAVAELRPQRFAAVRTATGAAANPGSATFQALRLSIEAVTEELVERLVREPQLVYRLTPRAFEELVAELFIQSGYDVDLTPATRDGGVDLWVAQQTGLGSFLYAVQCKKHAATNPIRVGMVRELLGTVYTADATAGVLVTTSYFSRDARALSEKHKYRISLHDYLSLQRWIANPSTWNVRALTAK